MQQWIQNYLAAQHRAYGSSITLPVPVTFYLDGIQYALGDLEADATPNAKLDPQPQPALPPEKK